MNLHWEQFKILKEFNFKNMNDYLDIGCNDCFLFKLIKQENPNANCLGVEPKIQNEEFKVIKPKELNKVKTMFDLITMLEVIEHLHWKEATEYFNYAAKHLKENGILLVSTPNINNVSILVNFWGDYDHIKPYTLEAIETIAKKSDLEIIKTEKIKHLFHPGKFLVNTLLGFDNHNGIFLTFKKKVK